MKFALLGFTAVLVLPLSSHADTINVPPGADIQPYIDGATAGDTIQLSEGTYSISTTLQNGYKDLMIRGVSRETTILDGNNLTRVMQLSGNVILSDVQIINGRAVMGGGLVVANQSQLEMTDCIISDCTATTGNGGGAIRTTADTSLLASNCIFRDNRAESGGFGGAICLDFKTPTRTYSLANCTFENNHANGDGGGVYVIADVTSIADCTFTGNTSDGNGGGVVLNDGFIENTTFTSNSAGSNGGGSYAINGRIIDSQYSSNDAGSNGGGAYALQATDFESCTFSNNEANFNGGGLRVFAPSGGFVQDCLFESNAANEGGGMHLQNAISERYILETCTFTGNSAGNGGGFAMSNSSRCDLIDCEIRNNDATSSGGGVWHDGPTSCFDMYVTRGVLCGNTLNGVNSFYANYSPCFDSPNGAPCLVEFCDQDTDGDGVIDCDDQCLEDPNKTEPGTCGCGNPDYDLDGDGVVDCNAVHNRTKDTLHDSLRDALPGITAGDEIAMGGGAVAGDAGPIFLDAANITFQLQDEVVIPEGMLLRTGPDTRFFDEAAEASFSVAGQLVAPNADTISFQSLEMIGSGQFLQNESLILVNETCRTSASGRMFLNGDILSSMMSTTDAGENRIAGDTNVFSDYDNAGATIVQRGTLYIYGDLVNTGTLSGDVNNGLNESESPEPGDGYSIAGNYTIGESASLVMPDPVWWLRVGGDLDIRIDDPARFVMAEATVELTGLSPEPVQTLEAMSLDLGAVESGIDPANYAIGSVRLRPGTTVEVVNDHDNSDGDGCEVVYADQLVVPVGASLVTSGCPIYVRSATIEGSVSNPDDIVIISEAPDCPADIDGDGTVNGADLARVLGSWATSDEDADVNEDGTVDGTDLAMILGEWGTICSD